MIGTAELQKHVEHMHGVKARLNDVARIKEVHDSKTVWEGVVHVFDITGHAKADTCYAWSSAAEGSNKRRFYAVLKIPPVVSPETAVKAAIVADHKAGRSP